MTAKGIALWFTWL